MAFASETLARHHRMGRHVGVTNVFHQFRWRITLYARICYQIFLGCLRYSIFHLLWKIFRFIKRALVYCRYGDGDDSFVSSNSVRRFIFVRNSQLLYAERELTLEHRGSSWESSKSHLHLRRGAYSGVYTFYVRKTSPISSLITLKPGGFNLVLMRNSSYSLIMAIVS
jgi:hypothetical protein